ncbi:hypothetical protein GGR58DRAFT_175317 [Xylaria digitata]|nr:hypothetical protein GGR58DRAFT_175317 [Xylaria digitata]
MSFAGRMLTQRSSALRSLTRRRAHHPALVSRKGYASTHGAAQKPSDMPLLVSAVGVTVVGLAYIMSSKPAPSGTHGPKPAHASVGHHKEEKEKEKPTEEAPSSESESKPESESAPDSQQDEKPADGTPKGAADPSARGKASQIGQDVPPPPADAATKSDETKRGHEELVETTRAGETKLATSSSTAPRKKTAAEDPREDPKKGQGEAVQKKGSSKD